MGTSGNKPRKIRDRLMKVPKYEEINNIQMAGIAEDAGTPGGTRLGHSTAHGRSENVGRFSKFFLRLLGRWSDEDR
jgi:hypothetical protein